MKKNTNKAIAKLRLQEEQRIDNMISATLRQPQSNPKLFEAMTFAGRLSEYGRLTKLSKKEILLWIRMNVLGTKMPAEFLKYSYRQRTIKTGLPEFPSLRFDVPGGEGFLYIRYYDYEKREMIQKSLQIHIFTNELPDPNSDPLWWFKHEEWKEICESLLKAYEMQIYGRHQERVKLNLHNSLKNWESIHHKFYADGGLTNIERRAIAILTFTRTPLKEGKYEEVKSRLSELLKLTKRNSRKL